MKKKKIELRVFTGHKKRCEERRRQDSTLFFPPYSKMKKIEEHNLLKDFLVIKLILIGVTF